MQSDATLPPEKRRNYTSVGNALTRIVKDEGFVGLFRGAGPTVVRAMALNMGMLASNDQVCVSLSFRLLCIFCKSSCCGRLATDNPTIDDALLTHRQQDMR